MFRIDDPSAAVALPTPEAAGTPGYFTEGNPGGGIAATLLRASWLNMLQEEVMSVLTAASISPSKTTYNQLLAAIRGVAQAQFTQSLLSTGYQKLPSGLIIQWGTGLAATSDYGNVFPIAFPSLCASMTLGNIDANPLTTYVSVSAITTTGFKLTTNTGGTRSVMWQAIGY